MAFPTFTAGDILNASDMNAVGLWKIASATLTGQNSVSFNNCFSSTYTNYLIVVNGNSCSAGAISIYMRMRAGGTDRTGAQYYEGEVGRYSDGSGAETNAAATNLGWNVGYFGTTSIGWGGSFDVYTPNLNQRTYYAGRYSYLVPGKYGTRHSGGAYDAATIDDGFTLYAATAATWTGSVVVYGYRGA